MKDTGEQTRRLARQQNAGALNNTPTPPGPTVWTGSYSYITPTTASAPNPGEIVHGDNVLSQMLFSKTDLGANVYSGAPVAIGDVLDINGTKYVIDAVPVDHGSYISVYIEPEIQLQPAVYGVTVYASNVPGTTGTPPAPVTPPTPLTNGSITGTGVVGSKLAAVPATFEDATSITGLWYKDGVATANNTLQITMLAGNVGSAFQYETTGSNAGGDTAVLSNIITCVP